MACTHAIDDGKIQGVVGKIGADKRSRRIGHCANICSPRDSLATPSDYPPDLLHKTGLPSKRRRSTASALKVSHHGYIRRSVLCSLWRRWEFLVVLLLDIHKRLRLFSSRLGVTGTSAEPPEERVLGTMCGTGGVSTGVCRR